MQGTGTALELPQGTGLCVLVNMCEDRIDISGVTTPISFKERQLQVPTSSPSLSQHTWQLLLHQQEHIWCTRALFQRWNR